MPLPRAAHRGHRVALPPHAATTHAGWPHRLDAFVQMTKKNQAAGCAIKVCVGGRPRHFWCLYSDDTPPPRAPNLTHKALTCPPPPIAPTRSRRPPATPWLPSPRTRHATFTMKCSLAVLCACVAALALSATTPTATDAKPVAIRIFDERKTSVVTVRWVVNFRSHPRSPRWPEITTVTQRTTNGTYSRSPKNPALQQLQKSSKSASTTPQRPIWNSFCNSWSAGFLGERLYYFKSSGLPHEQVLPYGVGVATGLPFEPSLRASVSPHELRELRQGQLDLLRKDVPLQMFLFVWLQVQARQDFQDGGARRGRGQHALARTKELLPVLTRWARGKRRRGR